MFDFKEEQFSLAMPDPEESDPDEDDDTGSVS